MNASRTNPSTFLERDEWLRAVLASDLPHVAARVAIRIGLHLNVASGQCNPGIDKIATGSNISERSAYRQIALLEQAGWIAIRRGGRGQGQCNQYTLIYPDRAVSGINPVYPDSGDNSTLPNRALYPATTVADKKRNSEENSAANAQAFAAKGRESRSRALAVIPTSALASVGALEVGKEGVDRFGDLWTLWWSESSFPDTDDDERKARKAFIDACGGDPAIADEIIAAARKFIPAVKAKGLNLPKLWKWLCRDNWRKPPPSPKPQRNGGKVSLSALALEIGGRS